MFLTVIILAIVDGLKVCYKKALTASPIKAFYPVNLEDSFFYGAEARPLLISLKYR